jgi:hypothetical protein
VEMWREVVYCLIQLNEADHWKEDHHDTTENLT